MTVILIDASIISVLFCQGRGIARTEQIAEREREREREREGVQTRVYLH